MQLATGVVSLSLGITAPAMGADVPSAIEQRADVSGGGDAIHGSPPKALQLRSDIQRYDAKLNLFIAEGNVEARLNGGTLRADRLEFDGSFNSLAASGRVRFSKGPQYFQASSLRFNLSEQSGVLVDVYGVLDLDSASLDFKLDSESPSGNGAADPLQQLTVDAPLPFQRDPSGLALPSERSALPQQGWPDPSPQPEPPASVASDAMLGMACPPQLPPIPDWHPHPWSATVWGGQSIDSNFGDTFVFNGRMRPEYLLGATLQKRIWRAGPFALELEGSLFAHQVYSQAGGAFNQPIPNAETSGQTFGEGILGLGARVWVQPWLSLGLVEGVSYFTSDSNYERTYRENYAQFLNYLGFELEAAVSPQLSLVGRIHHRSGAFGTYSGVREGSNAYLIGARYRWGHEPVTLLQSEMPPPVGCPDPDRLTRQPRRTLAEELEAITLNPNALNDTSDDAPAPADLSLTTASSLSLREQEALRAAAIARIDQRIDSIQFQQAFKIERRQGVPKGIQNSAIKDQNKYGGLRVIPSSGKVKLIEGEISRWRIQAAEIKITPEGWTADRMGFTNDPFTPAQTRIDADDVVARQTETGDILIASKRNRLIVEERFAVNISRTQRIAKEEEVNNRWVLGIDNDDRDGFFIGRDLKSINLFETFELNLQPQILVQRAIDGETNSYIEPNASIGSDTTRQATDIADLFGLEADLTGSVLGWNAEVNADISTFNPSNFANGSRFWADLDHDITLPVIGPSQVRLFGAYRYRTWNGSLGETDVYSAVGGFLENQGGWNWGRLSNSYLWRLGVGSYQAESFTDSALEDLLRANAYGSMNSSYSIWRGEPAALTPEAAYRYSPRPIVPGLTLNTNLNTSVTAYGDGTGQSTLSFSGGPTLTLGTFSKPFFDYTRLTVLGGGTLRTGASPFAFDQAIDLGTLGLGVTQQIAGPLVINAGVALNVDPNSEFYGDVINSNIELRWQRRSYDFGFYYNPYEGIGGFRFRLNDFNFTGTGVPFVPFNPRRLPNNLDGRPF